MRVFYLLIFLFVTLFGQDYKKLNKTGVEEFNSKRFNEAELNFRKGLNLNNTNDKLNFNLGDAYYKQEKYEDAINCFNKALNNSTDSELKSKAHFNIGNSYLKSNKIEQAIDSYKKAIKIDPKDFDSKYNLSYALNLLKNNQNKQKKQNKNDQNKNNQQKENNPEQQKKNDKNEQKQQNQDSKLNNSQINKKEAERILNAIKQNEKDLQKKLQKKLGVKSKSEKDW